MKLLNKPLGTYCQQAKGGIYLLAAMSVIRFLMKPVFNIPYEQGTTFTSVTILMILVMGYYAFRAGASGSGNYRDLLGIAAAIGLSTATMIIAGILIDEFGGIDTYYTDAAHGGSLNVWQHVGGHVVFTGVITPLVLWGIGSLVYYVANMNKKKAMA